MKSTFDFFNPKQEYFYEINPEIILCIKRISHSVAHLYFIDNCENRINIPTNLSIYSFDFQNISKRVLLEPIQQEYLLCWTENYEIEWSGEIKMVFQSQRQWDILYDNNR